MRHISPLSDEEIRKKSDLNCRLFQASGRFPARAGGLPREMQEALERRIVEEARNGNVRFVKGAISLGASRESMEKALKAAKEAARKNERMHKNCFYCGERRGFSAALFASQLAALVSSPHVYVSYYEQIMQILSSRLQGE